MITITTGDGKFFFSDFVNLFEEQSAEVDENALNLKELQYLLSAYNTKRIYINEEEYVKIRDRIALLSNPSSGGEVDLSGYATKTDLEGYTTIEGTQLAVSSYVDYAIAGITPQLNLKVDKVAGKGLSTNDFTNAHKTAVDNIQTTVNTAVAALVDGAPTTFDTLREIAAWIENEGVAATDLTSAIAEKADKTELSDYATTVAMTQLEGQVLDGLSSKVDKVEGKGLSTEDFTTTYKTKLDDIDNQKLDIPTSVAGSAYTTPTVNSVPLYTLNNNGDYVLCTPDVWLNINNIFVPGYNPITVQGLL